MRSISIFSCIWYLTWQFFSSLVYLETFLYKCNKFLHLHMIPAVHLLIKLNASIAFNFNCLTSIFFFPKNKFLASRRERTFMDARPWFRVVNSTVKMMTCYLRDKNKFLRYCTLCTSILKCKFPTKGIELARLKFFEDPRVPQLWSTWFRPLRLVRKLWSKKF